MLSAIDHTERKHIYIIFSLIQLTLIKKLTCLVILKEARCEKTIFKLLLVTSLM